MCMCVFVMKECGESESERQRKPVRLNELRTKVANHDGMRCEVLLLPST